MFLVHQHHVVIRHCNLGQPGMVCSRQIDFPERQAQSYGYGRYQYVMRTRHSPPSIENPIAETLKTFNRSGVVNAEPDVGIACQHRLPFLVFQGACRNKEIHWPSGFFSKRLKQLHPLLRNNPEQRIGYEVDFRPKLFEHRGSGTKVHCQQRLSFYKLRSFLHRTAQRRAVGQYQPLFRITERCR